MSSASIGAAASTTDGKLGFVLAANSLPALSYESIASGDPRPAHTLLHALRHRSHARIVLPPTIVALIRNYQSVIAPAYFGPPLTGSTAAAAAAAAARAARESECALSENEHRFGYYQKEAMGKEVFQVRVTAADAKWPAISAAATAAPTALPLTAASGTAASSVATASASGDAKTANTATEKAAGSIDFRSESERLYASLKAVAVTCFNAIGRALIPASAPADRAYWESLCDGEKPTDEPLSSTLLDVFHYYAHPPPPSNNSKVQTETCGNHTDYGLLTLIPAQFGGYDRERSAAAAAAASSWLRAPARVMISSGLEIFAGTMGMIPVEHASNANECVVFAGESLARLTGDFIQPTMHQVRLPANAAYANGGLPRISTPLLLFANPNRALKPAVTHSGVLDFHCYEMDLFARRKQRREQQQVMSDSDGESDADTNNPTAFDDAKEKSHVRYVADTLRRHPPEPPSNLFGAKWEPINACEFVLSVLKDRESITFGDGFRSLATSKLRAITNSKTTAAASASPAKG